MDKPISPWKAGKRRVFVERDNPVMPWSCMEREKAKRGGYLIIPCSLCNEPAIFLDPYYPYHNERNCCENIEHKGGKLRKQKEAQCSGT